MAKRFGTPGEGGNAGYDERETGNAPYYEPIQESIDDKVADTEERNMPAASVPILKYAATPNKSIVSRVVNYSVVYAAQFTIYTGSGALLGSICAAFFRALTYGVEGAQTGKYVGCSEQMEGYKEWLLVGAALGAGIMAAKAIHDIVIDPRFPEHPSYSPPCPDDGEERKRDNR